MKINFGWSAATIFVNQNIARVWVNDAVDESSIHHVVKRPNLGRCHQRQAVPKNKVGFGPTEGCVKVCQCISHRLHRGGLRAGRYTPIDIVVDERRRVYSAIHRVKPKSAKTLRVRREERQVALCKWNNFCRKFNAFCDKKWQFL